MAPRDYLDPWHDEVAATLGLLSVLMLVSIIGATLVNRAWKDRLAAAEAQVESESLYRRYIETAPEGIFIADPAGRYVDVNPAGCALVGYSRDELLRMTIRDLAPVRHGGRTRRALRGYQGSEDRGYRVQAAPQG
jgi:PAS domain-containing protein